MPMQADKCVCVCLLCMPVRGYVCVCVCECGWRSTSQSKACRAEANKQNALIRKFHYTKSNACQLYTHTHIHTHRHTHTTHSDAHSHSHTGKCKYNQWQCKQINAQRPARCIFPLPLRQFIKMPQPPSRSSTCPCHAHSPCGPVIEPSPPSPLPACAEPATVAAGKLRKTQFNNDCK